MFTVNLHLIADENSFGRFYDCTNHLEVIWYLHLELPFQGLDKVVEVIKNDIANTETYCMGTLLLPGTGTKYTNTFDSTN
jgi:hypothetical protein